MYSTSPEFMLGIVAALVTVIIATTVGAVAAYYGGLVDTIFHARGRPAHHHAPYPRPDSDGGAHVVWS